MATSKAGGVDFLVALARDDTAELRLLAAGALGNLADTNAEVQVPIAKKYGSAPPFADECEPLQSSSEYVHLPEAESSGMAGMHLGCV